MYVRKIVPRAGREALKGILYSALDGFDRVTRRSQDRIPPRRLRFVGDGDFVKTGREFVGYFRDLGGLKPGEHVLEVGCGVGRMAVALIEYLSSEGSYDGFDIVEKGIDWCRSNITSQFPNFRFQLSDVYSQFYNPRGRRLPKEYAFPFPDETFDFAFMTSVLTHMQPEDMEHYLVETRRVLRRGGRCLITFLLINEESSRLLSRNRGSLSFKHKLENYCLEDPSLPEFGIAYDESFVRKVYRDHGLEIVLPIDYGSWCGRDRFLSYQDIVIARRAP